MNPPALKGLSDKALLTQIEKLRRREHLSTIEILLHLNEVDRRRLHLKLGYSSLFDYCTGHLKYSASAAGRRVQVARCIRRHSEVLALLRSRDVNLSTISLIASVLTDDNKSDLLPRIRNRSQREVEVIASRYRRPLALRDRVKPVRVYVPEPRAAGRAQLESARHRPAKDNHTRVSAYSRSGSDIMLTKSGNGNGSSKAATRIEQKLLVQFLASKAFMKKYEQVRALLSQRLSDTTFEKVFEAIVDEFLEKHDPSKRQARREKRTASQKKSPASPPQRAASPKTRSSSPETTRRIPAAIRDKVFVRDGGRCTYVGKTGKRCKSTQALQIDHIKPVTRGGPNTLSNLRLLCAKHNRLAAEELFGDGFMKRFTRRE